MSGSTIGGVVGGVIGFVASGFNPAGFQWGFMIGSAIGGYVDPVKIQGPRLSDAMKQTGQEGVPIPFGYGTFPTAGNIIWTDKVIEHKKTQRQGKGGGAKQTTYTYTRSYAIGICEGPIAGLLMVKRNGKVVWDARSDAAIDEIPLPPDDGSVIRRVWRGAIRAANSRFFAFGAKFYLGDEEQLPDPTIEAVEGVGKVAAFRGLAYMVVKDDDVTDLQGAIPQYEFVVAVNGTAAPPSEEWAAGHYGEFADQAFPLVDTDVYYTFEGRRGAEEFAADSIAAVLAHFSTYYGASRPVNTYLGYFAIDERTEVNRFSAVQTQPSVLNSESLILVYNEGPPDHVVDAGAQGMCPVIPRAPDGLQGDEVWCDNIGILVFANSTYPPPSGYEIFNNCTNYAPIGGTGNFPQVIGTLPVYIKVTRRRGPPRPTPPAGYEPIPDAPGFYANAAGNIWQMRTYAPVEGSFKVLSTPAFLTASEQGPQRAHWEVGPALSAGHALDTPTFWQAEYEAAVAAGKLPAGLVYGVDYPSAVSTAWEAQDSDETIQTHAVTLASIVADLCRREGLDAADYDVSDLTVPVLGYKLATESGADGMIAALMPAFFFDAAEYDGKIRFRRRGGNATFSFGPGDLAERDGEAISFTRVQEAELLRKVTVGYIDPLTSYTTATQAWERSAGTVQAKGESAIEVPIVCTHAQAAQIAEKRGKVAWSETDKGEFSLPALRWSRLTPMDVGVYYDAEGAAIRLRIGQIEEDSGVYLIEATRDRQAAYVGTATGALPPPPILVDPPIIGPTLLAVMDLPALRSQDDALGVYVAAAGVLPGWQGADVQISTDGGATGASVLEATATATIGMVVAPVAPWVSSEYPATQSMIVRLADAPESIPVESLLRYGNRAAVRLASGAWELLQFQAVAANEDGSYTLSGLVRGRYATTPGAIAAGATFVLLDTAVQFVPIESWAIGTPLKVRAVPFGTDPDATAWSDLTLTGESQREWPVACLTAVRAGDDTVTVSWVPRPRLGVETAPLQSRFFAGYRVTFSDGHTADTSETSYARADTPVGVTVTVAALNSITGAGPSETIPT